MKETMLSQGAYRLAMINGRVKSGEHVLVITDYATTKLAERVASAAAALGGEVVTAVMPPGNITARSLRLRSPPPCGKPTSFSCRFRCPSRTPSP